MLLMTVRMAIMIVYTLQRLYNFTHRLVISLLAKKLKSLHFAERTLPLVHGQEITTKSFTTFPRPQNFHTKVWLLRKSHPTEAPSRLDYTILSFCQEHPWSWENNMLLNYAYPYQPCDCVVNMVTHSTNKSQASLAGTTTIQNCT
jgi:hypothetical protein